MPVGMPVRIALGRPRRPPAKLHRTTRSSLPVVICANNVSSSFGARAIPISPPSPKPEGETTPATSPTELTLPRFEIRTIRPEFRSETSASPELRKAIPQGTSRLSAMMPVTFGLGAAVRDGDAEGVRAELAEVGAGLGIPCDGSSSGEELDALWPPAVPEHPATAPRAAPAEPRSSVRRETTLNCGALAKAVHKSSVKTHPAIYATVEPKSGPVCRIREPERHLRCYVIVWRAALAMALLNSAALTTSACSAASGLPGGGTPSHDSVDPAADRAPGGQVVRSCGSHYATDFDAGLESRTVHADAVSLVGFRVSPVPSEGAPVRTFKVMVRVNAGTDAVIETATAGTSLLYDRARFNTGNTYQLSDGDRRVRFTGCPANSAVFNGAMLTSGPRKVELRVTTDSRTTPILVGAYGG